MIVVSPTSDVGVTTMVCLIGVFQIFFRLFHRLGEPVSMSGRECRSRFFDVPPSRQSDTTHSVGCLSAWFASWPTSTGIALSGVPGTHLGRFNSVEKLRGTDFCIGEISCYKPEHHGFWAPYGGRVIGSCYNLGNVFPVMIAAGRHLSEPPMPLRGWI